ncbi:sigma-70 family RNA polymerase sigma factor [Paraflavisolibacter sp. H34]|uniref:RNA polymerase sigma factor n=1 Tax=Huijunlia imazamoxiresistens TaxID=3127457 RepID=UPI00301673F3
MKFRYDGALQSDAEILYRFQNREEKALEEVYNRFYGSLCYFAEKLVVSRHAAEEIVVDVFIKTFRSTVTFSGMDHLQGYLYEAVKNGSLNYLKREKRQEKHFNDYLGTLNHNEAHFENEKLETSALELIFQAAEDLPTECRRVFELLYKEQMPYQDIAKKLQLNIQTVRNQNARAIAFIRKKLQCLR